MPRLLPYLSLLLLVASAIAADPAPLHRIDAQTPQGLMDLLKYTPEPLPLVSGHRGGAGIGYPENCIETFDRTLKATFSMLEIDPRYTKDGQIVIHHDPTLNRTTTGQGPVNERTLAELKQLRLKDLAGNVTDYQIPTLDETLEWARGKTILVLDQKDVPTPVRAKKVAAHKAESYALLIVGNFREVKACYDENPNIMMEVFIGTHDKIAEFDKLGVPWKNVIPFVGHVVPEDKTLYDAIHAKGARCMIGTSRNLDRQAAGKQFTNLPELEPAYRAFLARGADLLETDIPAHLGPQLYGAATPPAALKKFFTIK